MKADKRTYTIVCDDLCRIVGAYGAIICGKIATMCGEDNKPCEISNDMLCELLNVSKPTLAKELYKLQTLGYIEREKGDGRGNVTQYKKGKEILPFIISKRVKNFSKKGKEFLPIKYKENIKGEAHAYASTPQTTTKNLDIMFNEFWNLYRQVFPKMECEHERENCERMWYTMSERSKKEILSQLRNGKPYRRNANPYWYLHDFKPSLPIWKNGSAELADAMHDAEKGGYELVVARLNGEIVYCLPSNWEQVRTAGAVLIR